MKFMKQIISLNLNAQQKRKEVIVRWNKNGSWSIPTLRSVVPTQHLWKIKMQNYENELQIDDY